MEKKAKQGIMWYSADLASFLFKCAWKTLFLGFRAEILLLCAEILPLLRFVQKYYWPGTRGSLDSRAGPFLGSVKKYWFFGEIFTSAKLYVLLAPISISTLPLSSVKTRISFLQSCASRKFGFKLRTWIEIRTPISVLLYHHNIFWRPMVSVLLVGPRLRISSVTLTLGLA